MANGGMVVAAVDAAAASAAEAAGAVRVELIDGGEWNALIGAEAPADRAPLRELAAFGRFEGKSLQFLPWLRGDGRRGLLVGREPRGSATAALRSAMAAAVQAVADGGHVVV
ncbi:MAG: hypothetical protein FJ293_12505, partial [Planctomycetes bacterium]|nr:hypothetical protein [Planctomycetota bacterium]